MHIYNEFQNSKIKIFEFWPVVAQFTFFFFFFPFFRTLTHHIGEKSTKPFGKWNYEYLKSNQTICEKATKPKR